MLLAMIGPSPAVDATKHSPVADISARKTLMKRNLIIQTVAILIVAASCSRDRDSAANLMTEARSALAAKGMVVGTFDQVSNHPTAIAGREQVRCAAVSRDESDCRVCVISHADANAAIAAGNSKLRSALPEGSAYYVRGNVMFVVEPGPRRSTTFNQEVYDALTNLP